MTANATIDPFVADLLARVATNIREEFAERIERLEFDADFPNRLVICIGLLDVVQSRMSLRD
jgi:hypothetical protein